MPNEAVSWFINFKYWIFLMVIGLVGGTVHYINNLKSTKRGMTAFKLIELIGCMTIGAFTGLIIGSYCKYKGLDMDLTLAIVGVASSQGWNTMSVMGNMVNKLIQNQSNKK